MEPGKAPGLTVPSPQAILREAKAFTKNPLGIIGLFVVLIYGLAVLVAGFSTALTAGQRWVLVGLVAAFPPAVLVTFYRLVTKHPLKLYAPNDWRDESHFLRAMSPEEREAERTTEVAQIASAEFAAEIVRSPTQTVVEESQEAGGFPPWEVLFQQLREAEDLALSFLEREMREQIRRGVRIRGSVRDVTVDGAYTLPDFRSVRLYEVKVVRHLKVAGRLIDSALQTAALAAGNIRETSPDQKVFFTLALVTVGLSQEEREALQERAEERFSGTSIGTGVWVVDLRELRKQMGRTKSAG